MKQNFTPEPKKLFTPRFFGITVALVVLLSPKSWAQYDKNTNIKPLGPVREIHAETPLPRATGISSLSRPILPAGKTQLLSPVALGTSSNAFSTTREESNQVIACDSLGIVSFIHRQNVTVFGGGTSMNGILRYSLSIDSGQTFVNNIGPLQTIYSQYARFPQLALYNSLQSSNPFDVVGNYAAVGADPANLAWASMLTGACEMANSSPGSTENYVFNNQNPGIPGGLCQGVQGTFWTAHRMTDGNGDDGDTILVARGIWNGTDFTWNMQHKVRPDWSTTFDGEVHALSVNTAFSPDGQTGWVSLLGDLNEGHDSIYRPVFFHTEDGGNTWSPPVEIDLNAFPWIADTLRSLWTDSTGGPFFTGLATTAFESDLTVDANGVPHLAVVIGPATSTGMTDPSYLIWPGRNNFLADVYSLDSGETWQVDYLAPVLSLRSTVTPDFYLDNYPQVSRNEAGTHLFFSWTDTDSSGGRFGNTVNDVPNLRIVGKRVTDNYLTCYKLITDNDLVWGGKMITPTMSPIVLSSGSQYKLPIVGQELLSNDHLAPCAFWYFGNECTFDESDFLPPGTINRSWVGNCGPLEVNPPGAEPEPLQAFIYPNPSADVATLRFQLAKPSAVVLRIFNATGQLVMETSRNEYAAGISEIPLELSGLSTGLYQFELRAGAQRVSGKWIKE